MRTLSITGLSAEMRQRQYDNIAAARKDYEAAWKIYEQLPQTREEAETWKQFVPAWNAWRAENNKVMQLSQQLDHLLSVYEKSGRSKRQAYGEALAESDTRILETLAAFELQVREAGKTFSCGGATPCSSTGIGRRSKSRSRRSRLP